MEPPAKLWLPLLVQNTKIETHFEASKTINKRNTDFKPTKSNLSICYQTSVSIKPSKCNVKQETVKQSQPFTMNDFLSLAEASREEDDQQRKKEREEREKEREKDLRSLKSMLSLPPF